MAFPAEELTAALSLSDELFGIYPLLVYPCMVRKDRKGAMLRVREDGRSGRRRSMAMDERLA